MLQTHYSVSGTFLAGREPALGSCSGPLGLALLRRDAQRMASPFGSESNRRLVSHFIKANQGELLIQLVDPAALFVRLQSLGQEAQATA